MYGYADPPELAPYRLTIAAPPRGPARVEQTPAAALLPADADPLATARAALRTGDVARKGWALKLLGDAKARTDVPEISALLADPDVQSQAAMALGAIDDRSAVPALLAA
ncbi:MAG: HEAT repeat domain-containing protein [Deltaproteobacteria bacterium]|nr:HEAT repeat domain-containing protein [Deltaproteobacteria bacterium]